MQPTLYFYDLETSSVNPRSGRVMQFAGRRTDMQLKTVAEPDNFYIRMTDDILPEPDAILITAITPQKTRAEGITEAEFLKHFSANISVPGTIFVGFNNVRFDDEFIRFMLYRNFYDPYEWAWKDGRSRWDLLDVVRMARALRPEGIEWPFDSSGKPSNRLGLLTNINNLEHADAHDALCDVNATLAVARLLYNKQQKLFEYLFKMRDKKSVAALAESGQPFVYTSGKYPSVYQKTTVVTKLGEHPGKQGVLVYDLRSDPGQFSSMSPAELAIAWRERVEDETKRFPVKTMQYNRCPAVAPLNVLDAAAIENIGIDMDAIETNRKKLAGHPEFYQNLLGALKIMDRQRQVGLLPGEQEVDSQLYDGFFGEQDRTAISVVRAADKEEISSLDLQFSDQRLTMLLPLYKARNFPQVLTAEERAEWEKFRTHKLLDGGENSQAAKYFKRLSELSVVPGLSSESQYLLEELQLYGESILPTPDV